MKRRSALLLIATLSATSGAAQATDDELKLHPIAGLFGIEHSSCEPGQVAEVNIAPALCSRLVGMDRRQYWGHRFSDLVTDRFGATRIQEDLAAAPPAGLTRDAMLSRTLITSLHVSRAALWTVPRPSAVEVHMPVTVSLLMTNVLTGEVVFSQPLVEREVERCGAAVPNLKVDLVGVLAKEGVSLNAREIRDHVEQVSLHVHP